MFFLFLNFPFFKDLLFAISLKFKTIQNAYCANHPHQPSYSSLAHKHITCIQLYLILSQKNYAANLTQTWRCKVQFERSRYKTKSINFSRGNDSTVDFSINTAPWPWITLFLSTFKIKQVKLHIYLHLCIHLFLSFGFVGNLNKLHVLFAPVIWLHPNAKHSGISSAARKL